MNPVRNKAPSDDKKNNSERTRSGTISDGMKPIGDFLSNFEKKVAEAPKGRKRQTERGELMRFFLRHLNYSRKQDGLAPMTMAHLGTVLEKIPTQDLYYLKSVCSQAKSFSKKFWWELDPTKHPQR